MAEIREVYTEFLAEAKKEVRRRWPGSDAAHKISEDFSKVSEWTLKLNLERPSKRYQYDFVQSFPIMKRELNRICKILVRKTRPRATLKNQWKSIAKRAMPREVFLTLEHYLAEKGAVDDVSRTKCRCTLTGHQGLEDIFKELSSESPGQASFDEDIIVKKFRGGGYSRLEISGEKPIEFYYSYTTETIRVTCHYGFWNVHNIPQHIR